jgi:hypothetical protein
MMRTGTVSQESPEGIESDDEVISSIPHRELVAAAGKLARGEQAKLEKVLGLVNGRTPIPG